MQLSTIQRQFVLHWGEMGSLWGVNRTVSQIHALRSVHGKPLHADPLRYDIERADKTHFAFGGGAHFCLGAPLAKAEAEIAITRLLARLPHLALAERPVERNFAPAFNGVKALWVRA